MKRCTLCRVERPPSDFNRRSRSADGLQNVCRECNRVVSRAYYRRNTNRHREVVGERLARARERNRAIVWEVLTQSRCRDCDEVDPLVLEFDHVGDKRAAIAELVRSGVRDSVLRAELEQCEVVCAGCHSRRTWIRRRAQRLRSGLGTGTGPHRGRKMATRSANRARVRRLLAQVTCADCGEDDWFLLEFDHLRDKRANVSALLDCAWSTIAAEIAKCDVVCVNCHRRRTHRRGRTWRWRAVGRPGLEPGTTTD